MKDILLINGKIALAFAIFYAVYKLFLSNDTFFVRNRFYLLGAMLVSLVSPLLKFHKTIVVPALFNAPIVTNIDNPVIQPVAQPVNYWPMVIDIAIGIYFLGVMFYLIRIVWAYHRVISLILKSERKKLQGLILVITRLSLSPFSLLKWLVVPSHHLDHPDFENIVQHESIHSRQYHSVDLFLAEMLVAFQWFNPFAWWLKKSMVENHEFIVDQVVLQHGVDSRKYQYSLLNLSTGSGQLAGVNYFNANLIKKRIRMMNKTKSPKWHGLKNSMVLISIVTVVALTSSFETKIVAQNPDNEPEVLVNGKKSDMQTFRNINQHKVDSIVYHAQNQSSYGQAKKSTIEIYTGDTLKPLKSGNWDNVKVVGCANQKRDTLGIRCTSESGATIMISDKSKIPLIFLDGKKVSYEVINNSHPKEMRVIEGKDAISKYGEEGKNGVFLCYSSIQEPNPGIALRNVKKPGTNPLCFINGKRVTNDEFKSIKPEDISALTVFTGNDAIEKYGSEAKDGVMLLYTKPDSQIPRGIDIRNAGIPRNPLYVVNGKVEPDLDLSTINPNEVDKIEVITDADVIKKYGVQGRDVAIKITLKGVKEVATLSNSLSLTPNPTSNNVDITLKGTKTSGMFDVKIFDKYGKLLVQDKKSGPTFTVSVAGLPTGAYVVAVTDGKNKYTGNLSVVH